AFIAFAALSLSTTGARADGSWCANYGTGHSGINCSYTSQQQCLASVSGIYGFCTPNPYPATGYGRGGSWNLTPSGRARGYRAGWMGAGGGFLGFVGRDGAGEPARGGGAGNKKGHS